MGECYLMGDDVSKDRTHNYLRQIKGSVVFKAGSMGASFLAIPLMIRYLGEEQFGVWSTLLTVMSWIVFFDLGIGNGLRNKVAESLAKNKRAEARSYIASGYTFIAIISLLLYVLVYIFTPLVSWQTVFNIQTISQKTLQQTIRIAAFFIILNFLIGLVKSLLHSVQKTSIISLGQFVFNALVLLLVFVLTRTTEGSISYLAFAYGLSMIAANILLSIWFFLKNSDLVPKLSLDKLHVRPLLAVGFQFFIIQIAVLVIFTTDKILITQLFGPQYVTQYTVVFKLFSVITFAHTIITTPLWSAYTDAYHRKDFTWIKTILKKQLICFLCLCVTVLVLVFIAKQIITMWIGKDFVVSLPLVVTMGFFVIISMWNNIFAYFVNGIGKIKIQLYTAVVAMIVNIPLSIIFVKFLSFGLHGVLLGTCFSLVFAAMLLPIQVYKIIDVTR